MKLLFCQPDGAVMAEMVYPETSAWVARSGTFSHLRLLLDDGSVLRETAPWFPNFVGSGFITGHDYLTIPAIFWTLIKHERGPRWENVSDGALRPT